MEVFQKGLVKLWAIYFMKGKKKKKHRESPFPTHIQKTEQNAENIICPEFALKEPRQHSFIFEKVYD